MLIGSGTRGDELRPQLLDRFINAEVTESYLENRVAIVERREAYDRDPAGFNRAFENQQKQLVGRSRELVMLWQTSNRSRAVNENRAVLCRVESGRSSW